MRKARVLLQADIQCVFSSGAGMTCMARELGCPSLTMLNFCLHDGQKESSFSGSLCGDPHPLL